jgi:hypothetical protein
MTASQKEVVKQSDIDDLEDALLGEFERLDGEFKRLEELINLTRADNMGNLEAMVELQRSQEKLVTLGNVLHQGFNSRLAKLEAKRWWQVWK